MIVILIAILIVTIIFQYQIVIQLCKIIDDNDNDFYYISIIIKLKKNIVPIKVINSILKINKKVCSQAYLEGCNFINDYD